MKQRLSGSAIIKGAHYDAAPVVPRCPRVNGKVVQDTSARFRLLFNPSRPRSNRRAAVRKKSRSHNTAPFSEFNNPALVLQLFRSADHPRMLFAKRRKTPSTCVRWTSLRILEKALADRLRRDATADRRPLWDRSAVCSCAPR